MAAHLSLLHRQRATKNGQQQPKPPIALPEGHWQGTRYARRIAPLTRKDRRLFQNMFLAVVRRGSGDPYGYNCFLVIARLSRTFPIHTAPHPNGVATRHHPQ